jgi:hypothetical protein
MHAMKSIIVAIAALGLVSACAGTDHARQAGGVPEVAPRPSGEVEVRMPSGCVALYDSSGSLITRGSSCSASDRRRADEAAASYFREQGASDHSGEGGTPPEIMMGKNREAEVIFKNNCVVYYDARGRRTNKLSACTNDQVRRADQAIAAYRQEQGL